MITGARRKSLSLAGLMYLKVNALRVVIHRGNLSKPVTLRATDSGAQNTRRSFETITPAGKRSETDYREDSVSGAGGRCGAHHTASYKLPRRDKKGLRSEGIPVYGYSAPAKSGAGIGVLVIRMATHDAPSVFFCAVSLTHPFFERWDIIQRLARAMVAQAGASSEAPVSIRAGYANPAWATTSEIGVSGGSVTRYRMEAAAWLLPSPKIRNLFGLSQQFAAICRQLPPKFTISPLKLSRKPAAFWRGITFAFSPDVFAQGAHMLNYFRVAGCATARSGELVEFVYIVDARSAISAKADALNQARNERLSHIQITRVREVAA
ncbi:TPA: ash family protein [Salmonella enterica]|uniref:ash family protein n=2 Tax=Klebsiella pneumoniae complex TaxID=3390273 RepID=UPI0012BFFFAE|nr:HAD family hydrolase [Salmonella enterica subsp. enterica serovar Tennessee]EIR0291381.1 ash family protein [Salmonella enterica]EBK7415069.1 HAD family hydrolase [Salmonella enterica subsp. enterica serovar Tennessee]EBZ9852987.1 HAD family hydrolase [Salmonella enterica subsp. enterica serovar Tennessee]ECK7384131.1 HAD family hydrolase [Salmonella enterica subsp. enterica serovar Tennessee]